jgi:hypothetical protein
MTKYLDSAPFSVAMGGGKDFADNWERTFGKKDPPENAGIFIAEQGGTFVCDACIPKVDPPIDTDDPLVEVWEEGSGGWLSRDGMGCRICQRPIAVVLVGEAEEE